MLFLSNPPKYTMLHIELVIRPYTFLTIETTKYWTLLKDIYYRVSSFISVFLSFSFQLISQNLPQICTASAKVCICGLLKQMQYRFAVNFGTLSNRLLRSYVQFCHVILNLFISWVLGAPMVLLLYGSSEIGAHIMGKICYLICLRHLFYSRAVTNRIFFPRKNLFSLMRAQHVLNYHIYISIMGGG